MSKAQVDITGWHYGNIEVLGPAPNRRWHCRCCCGKRLEVSRTTLTRGMDSCGCITKGHARWAGHTFRSKWEVFAAMALEHLGIPYDYEPTLFKVRVRGRLRGYLPDFHLTDDDSWLEVKGSKRGVAKFNDFAKSHRARIMKKAEVERLIGLSLSSLYTRWRRHGPEACRDAIAAKLDEAEPKRVALASLGR